MDKRPIDNSKKRKGLFVMAAVFAVTLLGIWWAQKLYTTPTEAISVEKAAEMSISEEYTAPPDLEIAAPIYGDDVNAYDTGINDDAAELKLEIESFDPLADVEVASEEDVDTSPQQENAEVTPDTEIVQVDFDTYDSGAENDQDTDIIYDEITDDDVDVLKQQAIPPSYSPELDNLGDNLTVQAVLTAAKSAVISGSMDGVILSMPYDNGEKFRDGDVLVEYRCDYERARVAEIEARFRLSRRQVQALGRLQQSNTSSEVEYLTAVEQNEQNRALLEQAQAVERRCTIRAPFDGRVMDKEANEYEASRSGRVLMQIGSTEPLQAELLIPSEWLKWINIGTPVTVYVNESGLRYAASVIRIHGEVDPVSRTAHIVARLNDYQEELLPGMSGRATFNRGDLSIFSGFLGMNLGGR